jgi:hypothetical protein
LDSNDEVLGWNKHKTRIFKRPETVLGRNARKCHIEKSLDKVEKIILGMKEGELDKAQFWIDLKLSNYGKKQKIMIKYLAQLIQHVILLHVAVSASLNSNFLTFLLQLGQVFVNNIYYSLHHLIFKL